METWTGSYEDSQAVPGINGDTVCGGDDDNGDEVDGDGDADEPVPQSILDSVNFNRGRVRPNLSLDLSVGARLWTTGSRGVTLQFDVRNVTDRLNVINFSGLFCGTSLAPGRQVTVQLRNRS